MVLCVCVGVSLLALLCFMSKPRRQLPAGASLILPSGRSRRPKFGFSTLIAIPCCAFSLPPSPTQHTTPQDIPYPAIDVLAVYEDRRLHRSPGTSTPSPVPLHPPSCLAQCKLLLYPTPALVRQFWELSDRCCSLLRGRGSHGIVLDLGARSCAWLRPSVAFLFGTGLVPEVYLPLLRVPALAWPTSNWAAPAQAPHLANKPMLTKWEALISASSAWPLCESHFFGEPGLPCAGDS